MTTEKDRNNRPFAYPKPTETDEQLKNQPEFVDQEPNSSDDKELNGKPASNNYEPMKKEEKEK